MLAHHVLAEQPLLLLMLALYDADGNALQRVEVDLPQSELYQRLLRSFAHREVIKHRPGLPNRELHRAVDEELRRLSVVAFAMFNRGSQWVAAHDLDADLLALFGPPATAASGSDLRAPLRAAEIVIGRFFFVHRAQASRDDTQLETYEFLHATFGEFLVARLTWQVLLDIAAREAASTMSLGAAPLSGEDPLLVAVLKGSVSWQLMVSGRFGDAERVAVRTAESIELGHDASMQHLSAYGSLLLTAATAAARDNRSAAARDFLGSAAEVAHRLGSDRMDYETPFGPSQVTMQTVDVGVVTEDYSAALDAASRMPPNPGLPLAARCRHLADRACTHAHLGQKKQALTLLLTAEGMSADWIRHQSLVRAVIYDLLSVERARSTPLRELARRVGVNR